MVPEATQIGEKVIGEMKRSQIHIINAIQKTIAHLKKIPRLNLI